MTRRRIPAVVIVVVLLAFSVLAVLGGRAVFAQDAGQAKYSVRVPNGLAFSEFRGYESWEVITMSANARVVAVTVGNPAMIEAYKAGIPANGKPIPDGAKMAKVQWTPKPNQFFPDATVPGELVNVEVTEEQAVQFIRYMRRFARIKPRDYKSLTIICHADVWINKLL